MCHTDVIESVLDICGEESVGGLHTPTCLHHVGFNVLSIAAEQEYFKWEPTTNTGMLFGGLEWGSTFPNHYFNHVDGLSCVISELPNR